jgi:hypothetical protein
MKYALGNMLNGAGGLNADGLSLDLQFATDKTLTARKGPTPVFTRASTATFVGSNGLIQSAAINSPRFDHTSAGVCLGLLIEESRTNLYTRSEEFETVSWTKTRSSITANATTAPDGTLTADKFVEDTTASNTHTLSSSVTPPATAHTLSVFAKKGERTWIVLRLGAANTFFNLDDGTIAAGSVNSPTITAFGNGWYRCSVTSSGGTQGQFWLATNSTTTSYTGDGTSGLFLWGAQLEAGSFPTSYIPTVAASAVRSADVCSITGSAFTGFWNPSEGTLFASGVTRGYPVMASSGVNSNQIAIFRNSSPLYMRFDVASGGAYTAQIISATIADGSFNKTAGSYAANDARAAFNGTLGTADITVTVPSNLTTLNIGSQSLGSSPHNGHIAAIRYFKKRLSNAKLASFTV